MTLTRFLFMLKYRSGARPEDVSRLRWIGIQSWYLKHLNSGELEEYYAIATRNPNSA